MALPLRLQHHAHATTRTKHNWNHNCSPTCFRFQSAPCVSCVSVASAVFTAAISNIKSVATHRFASQILLRGMSAVQEQGQKQPCEFLPPYAEGDACSEEQLVKCYRLECKFKATSCGKMLKHVSNPISSGGHGISWKTLKREPPP